MDYRSEQLKRLERFTHYLMGKFPDEETRRAAHVETARRFELFLLGRDLSFSQEAFRMYLLEMHRAAVRSKEERDAEQARLRLYYHCLREEADAAEAETASRPLSSAPSESAESALRPGDPETAPPPFSDLPGEDEIVCPKCGHRQPRGDECAKCGVVFEKWKHRRAQQSQRADHPSTQLHELRRQVEGRMARRRYEARPRDSKIDPVLLYLVAPLAALLLFALFRGLNASQRERLVKTEQRLVVLKTEIEQIDEPPLVPTDCALVTTGQSRPPAPFQLYVQENLTLTPGRDAKIALSLAPFIDPLLSAVFVEELTISMQRSWLDTSVGTQGLRQIENVWNGKTLFREPPQEPLPKRPPALETAQSPVWDYELDVEKAVTGAGQYTIDASLLLWYPDHPALFPAAYRWTRISMSCEPKTVTVRTFDQTRELRAVMQTQRIGLEETVKKLRRHERITRIAKFSLATLLVLLGTLIFYRAFINVEREEERQIKAHIEPPPPGE